MGLVVQGKWDAVASLVWRKYNGNLGAISTERLRLQFPSGIYPPIPSNMIVFFLFFIFILHTPQRAQFVDDILQEV